MTIDEINTIRLALDTPEHNRHYIKHVTDAKIILNKEQEAINFTDSSLQLKEKYKKVSFNEWLELMGYYKKKDKWYNKHGYLRSYQRLIVKYESFTSDL